MPRKKVTKAKIKKKVDRTLPSALFETVNKVVELVEKLEPRQRCLLRQIVVTAFQDNEEEDY